MGEKRIKVNQARCNRCGDLTVSTHRHDYVQCSCGGCAVDGGRAYLRRAVQDGCNYTELSEIEESRDGE